MARIKGELPQSKVDVLALQVYERTMVGNRTDVAGRVIGGRIHALVRIAPLALPPGFALLWLYAFIFAPAVTA